MLQELRPALVAVLLTTVLTGLIYPFAVTGIAQTVFPTAANGSLVVKDGKIIGSELIAQNFTKPEYFHPRPSARNYDAADSGASNAAPSSKQLIADITERTKALRAELGDERKVPIELVTTSASGLDPHISPEAAYAQAKRVALARNMAEGDVWKHIASHIEDRTFSLLGEQRVNVLRLNLALDALPRTEAGSP